MRSPRCALLLTLFTLCGRRSCSTRLATEDDLQAEGSNGSVCFNNCSGHGQCIDYTCQCDVGYDGDDCSFCFFDDGDNVYPILSVGDVNLTSSNFHETLHNARNLLVVVTSRSCHRCLHLEMEYKSASSELKQAGTLLGRVDADIERPLLDDILGGSEAAAQHLPAIVLWTTRRKSTKSFLYDGAHERHDIVEFVSKQLAPPVKELTSITAVDKFVANPRFHAMGANSPEVVTVVAFFSDAGEMEEDEVEDFIEAAADLRSRSDIYFGVVNDAAICGHFSKLEWIQRASEAVLTRQGQLRAPSLTLWALLEDNISIQDWIIRESLPLVGQLTNANFAQYERTHLPMLIMFLELPDSYRVGSAPRSRIGGTSGGVKNDELVKELKGVALEHKGRVTCLYADGITLADSMKTLGLFGSRERLPQVGFNTMDGRQLPFPEDLPINRETLLHFAAAFLSGRLQSSLDAKKAMMVSRPFNTYNTVRRKNKRSAPDEIQGVSEQLKPKDAIIQVTRGSFSRVILDNDKDVLLMFHSEDVKLSMSPSLSVDAIQESASYESKPCSHESFLAAASTCLTLSFHLPGMREVQPYDAILQGERFLDLNIPSVLVAAMDVTLETPPPEVGITLPTLPAILLLPGDNKEAPFRFFSGVGKVGPLMRWLHEHASTSFELPVLPHLPEADKPLFRKQVRERQQLQAERIASQS